MRVSTLRLITLLTTLLLFLATIPAGAQEPTFKVSTPEEIKEDFSAETKQLSTAR